MKKSLIILSMALSGLVQAAEQHTWFNNNKPIAYSNGNTIYEIDTHREVAWIDRKFLIRDMNGNIVAYITPMNSDGMSDIRDKKGFVKIGQWR